MPTNSPTSTEPVIERREQVARALSIPQHHTTWDTLTEREKDLFYMQADYAIKACDASRNTPADSEVAELVMQVRNELYLNYADRTSHLIAKLDNALLALSRTEPMVTDALVDAGAIALAEVVAQEMGECGQFTATQALKAALLAMGLSAGKKGTDDAAR